MSLATLTTDFGSDSPYVAQMRGVLLSIAPRATIVDITHSIPPQDIRQGARVLADVAPHFPAGTVHVAVVDPGVGTDRDIMCVETMGMRFVLPNNGLITQLVECETPAAIHRLTSREHFAPKVSSTFHGRDIMAPVAAHLLNGVSPDELGPALDVDDLVRLRLPRPNIQGESLVGEIVSIDGFGNLVSNVSAELLRETFGEESIAVDCRPFFAVDVGKTYGQVEVGAAIALIGSSGWLEVAIRDGNAAKEGGVAAGNTIRVNRQP
jgi:S-adenosylmethionine hydrolase